MLRRLALLAIIPLLLALLFPMPCLAAESDVAPVPKAALDPDIDEGHRLFAHEKYEEALKHYLKALERNEEDAELLYRITTTYVFLGKEKKALAFLDCALAINPGIESNFILKSQGYAMSPTLIDGDYTLIDYEHYKYNDVKRRDIVLIKLDIFGGILLPKRVVGIPGDTVTRNSGNYYVNDKKIELGNPRYNHFLIENNGKKITIPKNKFFILSDNATNSIDSKFFGLIENNDVVGKVMSILHSSYVENGVELEREDRIRLKLK